MQVAPQPKQVFTSRDLDALDLALVGALATADELGVERKGMEGALRRRLFVLASEGITDPREAAEYASQEYERGQNRRLR